MDDKDFKIQILERNIRELQEQLQRANRRIVELSEILSVCPEPEDNP